MTSLITELRLRSIGRCPANRQAPERTSLRRLDFASLSRATRNVLAETFVRSRHGRTNCHLGGGVAALCTTVSYFPQLKKCWQTGETGDLSLHNVRYSLVWRRSLDSL